MTIIVFLIDTSASMNQKTYVGGRTTLLDVAKSAVETFVKIRQRSPESRIDRYMLLTFEESPNNIKAGWKENLATFMNELKNLQCYSMTSMGVAVKQAFDILNINRVTSGIDTYGQGRCPFFLETSVIVLITDGGKLSSINGVHEDFTLPMTCQIPGAEMTREPFRWDQRLFALVLRLAGTPAVERDAGLVPSDSSPIDAMCEVTGGRSYSITSHRVLNQCIDSLVQKVLNGVVINFEKIGPDPPPPNFDKIDDVLKDEESSREYDNSNDTPLILERPIATALPVIPLGNSSWHNCRKMIYVQKNQKGFPLGFWPIPESFWPDMNATVLPPRSAHPNVKFTCTNSDPMVIENLPFDKYELEPSPLTQYILSRKQPTVCWQVFVANSYKNSEVGHPFGYLKASTNLNCVNLFVMPYNYPVLLPLLDELLKIHRWKPTNEWRTQFQNYMRTLPSYYAAPLRRALTRMGSPVALAQTLIPETAENGISYSVNNYLKRLKNQAKIEYDRLCSEILQRQTQFMNKNNFNLPEQIRITPRVTLKKDLITHPLLIDKFNAQRDQLLEQGNLFICSIENKERHLVSFKNPFDIPRNRLMQQVARMRNNFLQSDWIAQDLDIAHSLPISQMGNYQEYLKRQTPQLREIESTPVRQHMFGNPFKIDKRMMVDEADIDLVGSGAPGSKGSNKRSAINIIDSVSRIPTKRKPGPLPKDLVVRKPTADVLNNAQTNNHKTVGGSSSSSPVVQTQCRLNSPSNVEKENVGASSNEDKPTQQSHVNVIVNSNSNVNGVSVGFLEQTRSRSPSPPHHQQYNNQSICLNELVQNVNNVSSENSKAAIHNIHMNQTVCYSPSGFDNANEFTYSTSNSSNICDDKHISQILKEANSLWNASGNVNEDEINDKQNNSKIKQESEEEIEEHNLETRKLLYKLVRRPGKNFAQLFNSIDLLKGEVEVQVEVVRHVIIESLRFKRQQLAKMLEDHIQSLTNFENK